MLKSAIEVKKIARKTAHFLKNNIEIERGDLFGSYAIGTPHKDSDIDLAFFSPTVNKMRLDDKITFLSKMAREVDSAVEIHLFAATCLKEARPTNFYGHIIKTGKRIV